MVYLNWIFALLGAVMVGLLKDEVAAWLPKLAQWCVCRAADQMPDRERWREEWLAHLNECPGRLGQFVHALGVLTTAWRYKIGSKLSFYFEVFRYMQSPRWALIDVVLSIFSITFMILFTYFYFLTGVFDNLYFFVALAFSITTFWSDYKFKKAYKIDKSAIEYFLEIRDMKNK